MCVAYVAVVFRGYNKFFRIDQLAADGFLSSSDELHLKFYVRSPSYYFLHADSERYIQHLEIINQQAQQAAIDAQQQLARMQRIKRAHRASSPDTLITPTDAVISTPSSPSPAALPSVYAASAPPSPDSSSSPSVSSDEHSTEIVNDDEESIDGEMESQQQQQQYEQQQYEQHEQPAQQQAWTQREQPLQQHANISALHPEQKEHEDAVHSVNVLSPSPPSSTVASSALTVPPPPISPSDGLLAESVQSYLRVEYGANADNAHQRQLRYRMEQKTNQLKTIKTHQDDSEPGEPANTPLYTYDTTREEQLSHATPTLLTSDGDDHSPGRASSTAPVTPLSSYVSPLPVYLSFPPPSFSVPVPLPVRSSSIDNELKDDSSSVQKSPVRRQITNNTNTTKTIQTRRPTKPQQEAAQINNHQYALQQPEVQLYGKRMGEGAYCVHWCCLLVHVSCCFPICIVVFTGSVAESSSSSHPSSSTHRIPTAPVPALTPSPSPSPHTRPSSINANTNINTTTSSSTQEQTRTERKNSGIATAVAAAATAATAATAAPGRRSSFGVDPTSTVTATSSTVPLPFVSTLSTFSPSIRTPNNNLDEQSLLSTTSTPAPAPAQTVVETEESDSEEQQQTK